jgi:hypothetical protein
MTEPDGVICAAPDCDNPLPERSGRGRPFIYCTPACRPTGARPHREPLEVQLDHEPTHADERPTGRVWSIALRRGANSVIVAAELGRPSAENLAAQISALLDDRPQSKEMPSTKI